jgi:tripartite-type tricarboxylate transporter receptor subunit TctC
MPLRSLACLLLACAASMAHAQAWPTRPVRMIVPFPAGGPTDVMTRIVCDKLGQALGQPVVVENKPGAGGAIGADFVAKSAADGYTLLMATGSTHSVGPYLQKLPYDPNRDFTPLVYVGYSSNILLASPKLGVNNVRELIEYARKEQGRLTYATSGIGSVAHLTSEMFASMAGVKLTHVPYKGLQLSINDLISGDVGILFDSLVTGKPHADGGRLKALAVTSATRSSIAPDIPTVAESGLPGFESRVWFGVFGPPGLPRDMAERFDAVLNRILADTAVRERFRTLGFEVTGGNAAALAAVMQDDARKWSKVIRDANVKAE